MMNYFLKKKKNFFFLYVCKSQSNVDVSKIRLLLKGKKSHLKREIWMSLEELSFLGKQGGVLHKQGLSVISLYV